MSLRRKFVIYLVLIHVPFAALAVYVFARNRLVLFAVELLFVVSFLAGIRLVRSFFKPLDLIRTGAQFIQESDFTSRFLEPGQPDMDHLVQIYNRMVDHLREERIRLQEQHFFLDKILNASPSGIITLALDGRIAMVSPGAEKILQRAKGELLGQKLAKLEGAVARELSALGTGAARVVPVLGSRRVRCTHLEFFDCGFARTFFVLEDLTEELRHSEKAAYEKLIRMMSHEVNNSVGAASSLLESCLTYRDQIREPDRGDFESALRVVIERASQLNVFMRGFSDVVRIPSPRLQEGNLLTVLEGVVALHRAEADARRIRCMWEIQPGVLDSLVMDRAQIEQVLVNIVKNAMEAIGEDGTITMRAGRGEAGDERAWLVIEDTGCGIAPEVGENLFTPFYSTKRNGQGIGLTTIQEILTQHMFGFSLEALTGGPTRFTIRF